VTLAGNSQGGKIVLQRTGEGILRLVPRAMAAASVAPANPPTGNKPSAGQKTVATRVIQRLDLSGDPDRSWQRRWRVIAHLPARRGPATAYAIDPRLPGNLRTKTPSWYSPAGRNSRQTLTRLRSQPRRRRTEPEDTEQADRRAHHSHETVSTQDAESAIWRSRGLGAQLL
jgi:hypothetical protein